MLFILSQFAKTIKLIVSKIVSGVTDGEALDESFGAENVSRW